MKTYYVYIMTNKYGKVFYTGFTDDIERRSWEHKNEIYPNSFTKKYNINKLVYFVEVEDKDTGLALEKRIKKYSRDKKIKLIESINDTWEDLYQTFYPPEN